MKFPPSTKPSTVFTPLVPLTSLFNNPDLQNDCTELGFIASGPIRYATLNRFEFEGSLISILLEGGCHRKSIPEHDARVIVHEALAVIFPKPFDNVLAFRPDDPSWSEFSREATISHSYVVWQGARGLWWILCIADID